MFDSDAATNDKVRAAERALAATLAAAGAVPTVVRLPAGADGVKQGLDDFLVANGHAALRALLDAPPPDSPQAEHGGSKERDKPPSAADILAGIAAGFDLWHDAQAAFATAGRRSLPVRFKAFRNLLVHEYRKQSGGKVPNAEAVAAAVTAAEAAAVFDGPERPAHTRVAGHGGTVYLHLADADATVIEIDAAGWRACDDPPVRFWKPAGMRPLPVPTRGGRLADLRRFVNVPDDDAFALVLAWLAGAGPSPPPPAADDAPEDQWDDDAEAAGSPSAAESGLGDGGDDGDGPVFTGGRLFRDYADGMLPD